MTDDLTTDYQFTFNLSKDEDRFYTRINFMNIPAKVNDLSLLYQMIIIIIIIIIIIVAEMAVFNAAGYLRGKEQVACNLMLPHEENILNKLSKNVRETIDIFFSENQ